MINREAILKQYAEDRTSSDSKSYLCRFHLRGLCILTADECKFAHSLKDFVIRQPLLDVFTEPPSLVIEDSNSETKTKQLTDKEPQSLSAQKQAQIQQKPLGLERTYKSLTHYQEELVARGDLKESDVVSQNVLDSTGPIRRKIRNRMLNELTKRLCDMLFKELNTNALKRSSLERFFTEIGWTLYGPSLLDGHYAFETKQKSSATIIKLPPTEAFKELVEDNIINIIQKFKLEDSLPISPMVLTKHYYKDHLPANPLEPSLQIFQKHTGLTLDQYLQSLQKSDEFLNRLAAKIELNPEELKSRVVFQTLSDEWRQFCLKIDQLMRDYMKEAPLGIARYQDFESKVLTDCKEEIKTYNNNLPYIKKMIKCVALRHKILIINLLSGVYLLSLDSLRHTTSQDKQKLETLFSACNPQARSNFKYPEFHVHEHKDGTVIEPPTRFPPELLEKEINMSKIVVVDNRESLTAAIDASKNAKTIGVDLEGSLDLTGRVEMVQCEINGTVFIFDLYLLCTKAATNTDEEEPRRLYQDTLDFIKYIMESPAYCKIFQDGRKDSTGLHSAANSCVVNTFDVSGIYKLINQLEMYYKHHKALNLEDLKKAPSATITNNEHLSDEKCVEIFQALELVSRPPNLNDVLGAYKASHGLNNLKTLMKERFCTMQRGYFLQRPIDKEFLIYSAKDVEDLSEVRTKMLVRLTDVLKKYYGNIPSEVVELFSSHISYTYTVQGCNECYNSQIIEE